MISTPHFLFAAVAGAGLLLAAGAQAQPFQEGIHYERIPGPDLATENGAVEVVEVFSYLCPHCRTFHPYISAWEEDLPENVTFRRVPVIFQRGWEPFARAYYAAEDLEILGESHEALFKAIHDEGQNIRSIDDLVRFHSRFGVDAERFRSATRSFSVDSKVRQSNAEVGRWQVRATPSVVVNGKWRVSPRRGGTFDELIAVINYLVEQEIGIEKEEVEVDEAPAS